MTATIWQDPRVTHYQAEGAFGYLHHPVRTPETDELIERLARDAGYDDERIVGLLVSRMGRIAGDELTFQDGALRLRVFLRSSLTRGHCYASARAYQEEIEAR